MRKRWKKDYFRL